MCYMGCKYENFHGGCNKGPLKICPHEEIDFPVCANYETNCIYNDYGYCKSENECEYRE